MAKTFKNLPPPGTLTASKPASERDFFDLTEEPLPVEKPVDKVKSMSNTSNKSNTGNKRNTSNISNTTESPSTITEPADVRAGSEGVRQTFVVGRGHLEQLRDYVHARRSQGEYTYSQKQALQEALDLLFASGPAVPQRPEQTRKLEQQQQERIKRGRAR
jgi:hypothetical protein